MNHDNLENPPKAASSGGVTWMLAGGLLVLAGVLWAMSPGGRTPGAATPEIDRTALAVGPRRKVMSDPPAVMIAGFEQRCNACHKLFQSNWDGVRPLTQHQHIALSHGINNQCDNCHARDDRERLVLHDGSQVSFARTEALCAQCHGPVFRDWQRGTHGKTLGSWDLGSPQARRLSCAECHDPHAPGYAPIAPLPGPNTLRMGSADEAREGHGPERNPLRRWSTEQNGGH